MVSLSQSATLWFYILKTLDKKFSFFFTKIYRNLKNKNHFIVARYELVVLY